MYAEPSETFSNALACWSRASLIVSRTRPVDAGPKNACAAPNSAESHDEHPDLHRVREQRDGDNRLDRRADPVAGEHHEPPRKAVGPDSADDDEAARERERRKDEAELAASPPVWSTANGSATKITRVADGGSRLSQPQQPELPLLERSSLLTDRR